MPSLVSALFDNGPFVRLLGPADQETSGSTFNPARNQALWTSAPRSFKFHK